MMSSIKKLSDRIGHSFASELNLDNDKQEIISYGAFALLQSTCSIFLVALLGFLLGVLYQTLFVSFSIAILRKYSGGVHASTPSRCILLGIFVIITISLIVVHIFSKLNFNVLLIFNLISFVFSFVKIYKLAPVDSSAKPIRKTEKIKRLKKYSLYIFFSLSVIAAILLILYITYFNLFLLTLSESIMLALLWQTFTLTSLGHKIVTQIDATFNLFDRR